MFVNSMSKIGSGYYGTIYRTGPNSAVKITKDKTSHMEYKIANLLKDFNVPRVYGYKTCKENVCKYSMHYEYIKGKRMDKWLKTKPNLQKRKSILFQVIYNLYKIHKKYPRFRHNDCQLGNIIIRRVPVRNIVVKLKSDTLEISNQGVEPVFIDFGHSLFPGIKSPLEGGSDFKRFNIRRNSHKMSDVQHFLYSFYKKNDTTINNYIKRLLPIEYLKESKLVKYGRICKSVNHDRIPSFETMLTKLATI